MNTPIVVATRVRGVSEFYCVYCKKKHIHGPQSGSRHAHCTNRDSPYYGQDYYLEVKNG